MFKEIGLIVGFQENIFINAMKMLPRIYRSNFTI